MKNLFLFLLLLPFFVSAQSGMLTTVAGTPFRGDTTGDGGPAIRALIHSPRALTADQHGNIYMICGTAIRKISTSGIITRVGGAHYPVSGYLESVDGSAATSDIVNANNILVDRIGNIYLTHRYGNNIRKIDTSGIISTIIGLGGTPADDGEPATSTIVTNATMTMSRNGEFVFYDDATNSVYRIDTGGILRRIAGRRDTLHNVTAMCNDNQGNIYLFDNGSRIRKIDTNGIINTIAGTGTWGYTGDGGPATAAKINGYYNYSMYCDPSTSEVYFTDVIHGVIRKVDRFGIISTVAGTVRGIAYPIDGIDPLSCRFYDVNICVDHNQNIYISDGNALVRKIELPQIRCDSFQTYLTKLCNGINLRVQLAHSRSGLYILSYFGDGTRDSTAVSSGLVPINHDYSFSGTYTLKQYLCHSGVRLDSISTTFNHSRCTTFDLNIYHEDSFNCLQSRREQLISQPSLVQVDSNGITIDTVSCLGRLKYYENGNPGDVYKYKIIEMPRGVYPYCPTTAVFKDSIQPTIYRTPTVTQAMRCDSSTTIDLKTRLIVNGTGSHAQKGVIYASNDACTAAAGTITLYFDPRFALYSASDTPSSTGTGFASWSLPNLSIVDGFPYSIAYHLETFGGVRLLPGNTVRSKARLSTSAMEADTTNNVVERIDTSKSSYDPNEVLVTPNCLNNGDVAQRLEYTIHFENTGNDTAFNIYVMDTLPNFVNPKSLRIIMSSHDMVVSHLNDAAGRHVVKFDFPRINLLDTSHHGVCDGALIYTINTKAGIPMGTRIANRAGIYFDDNEVVLTNYAVTNIGCTLDLNDMEDIDGIRIFPNPAGSQVTISSKGDLLSKIIISDILGKVNQCYVGNGANTEIDISQLSAGIYSIRAIGKQGVYIGKFTKL